MVPHVKNGSTFACYLSVKNGWSGLSKDLLRTLPFLVWHLCVNCGWFNFNKGGVRVISLGRGVNLLSLHTNKYSNVMSQQGHSLNVSLVINLQGQNKKTRILNVSYKE